MVKFALIFVCSGLGGVLRHALGGLIQHWWGPTFPLGTLIVNITGCLGIGFFAAAFAGGLMVREEYRIAVLVGIFGGYTTFSAFGLETMALVGKGDMARAGLNVLLSVAVGLVAVWFGAALGARVFGPGVP